MNSNLLRGIFVAFVIKAVLEFLKKGKGDKKIPRNTSRVDNTFSGTGRNDINTKNAESKSSNKDRGKTSYRKKNPMDLIKLEKSKENLTPMERMARREKELENMNK